MAQEGRVIGLDVGEARTGVAVSDPLGIIATAYDTIRARTPKDVAAEVLRIVQDKEAVRVVVGLPLDREGKIGPQASKVLEYVEALRDTLDVDVDTQDERFSTAAADRALRDAGVSGRARKGVVDKVSAQQILQLYLDRQAHLRERGNG